MSIFPSKLSIASGVVALSLLAGAATATPISLVYDGPSVATQNDREVVHITAPAIANAPAGGVYAFGFNMIDTTNTLGSFLAWCLDIGSSLSTSSTDAKTYKITDMPFSNSYGLDDVEKARVQSVFDANFGALTVTNGVEAAGFQVALWNALYDSDALADNGVFQVSVTNPDVITKANAYLAAAASYGDGPQRYRMSFLESANSANSGPDSTPTSAHQNLVTVSAVPLPAAGVLLLAALGGLGFAGRRRKAAA